VSDGRAPEIRYDDAKRLITFGLPPGVVAPAVSPAPATPVAAAPPAQPGVPTAAAPPVAPPPLSIARLSGPQGDLRGTRIEVVLAKTESRIERLEAYTDVNVRLDTRSAVGDRLTFHAGDERYVMTGLPTIPVRIIEECRETTGRTVTFFKAADRIIVDGEEEVRTRSSRGGPCPQMPRAPAR
jgi:hypothetical protein